MEGHRADSAGARRTHLIRVWVGVGLLIAVAAVVLIPARSSNERDPVPPGHAGLSRVLLTLNQYTLVNDGRYPPPDLVAQCLIANGHLSPDEFSVASSTSHEPIYFFVTPQRTELREAQPLLYTNPSLTKDRSISVGYNDNHVERFSPIQARAFLTSVAPRSIPIK